MIDTNQNGTLPTGKNIKDGLYDLVAGSVPGDVLVFHFSGHGMPIYIYVCMCVYVCV